MIKTNAIAIDIIFEMMGWSFSDLQSEPETIILDEEAVSYYLDYSIYGLNRYYEQNSEANF